MENGVGFTHIDVEHDPGGRDQLLQYGLRHCPVVAKGKAFVIGKDLNVVAEFVGVPGPKHIPLPPEELFKKWLTILRAAQRFVRQIPDEKMHLSSSDLKNKPIRLLEHHVFSIGAAYIACANDSRELSKLSNPPLLDGTFTTSKEMASYADEIIASLENWWNDSTNHSWQRELDVDYFAGTVRYTLHRLFERCVWHSAHHARQLADWLERQGIDPNGTLTNELLAGLPLPKKVWDS